MTTYHYNVRTLLCQTDGTLQAYAATCPGDQNSFVIHGYSLEDNCTSTHLCAPLLKIYDIMPVL
jgi:hypothetical protein